MNLHNIRSLITHYLARSTVIWVCRIRISGNIVEINYYPAVRICSDYRIIIWIVPLPGIQVFKNAINSIPMIISYISITKRHIRTPRNTVVIRICVIVKTHLVGSCSIERNQPIATNHKRILFYTKEIKRKTYRIGCRKLVII